MTDFQVGDRVSADEIVSVDVTGDHFPLITQPEDGE